MWYIYTIEFYSTLKKNKSMRLEVKLDGTIGHKVK